MPRTCSRSRKPASSSWVTISPAFCRLQPSCSASFVALVSTTRRLPSSPAMQINVNRAENSLTPSARCSCSAASGITVTFSPPPGASPSVVYAAMVLVTSKTSAGRAAVGALACWGRTGGIDQASFSGAGRAAPQQRTHAPRGQQDDPTDPVSLCGVYSGGFRRSSGVDVASAGRLVPRCVSGVPQLTTPLPRARQRCTDASFLLLSRVPGGTRGQAAAAVTTSGTVRAVTSSEATATGYLRR